MKQPKPKIVKLLNVLLFLVKLPAILISTLILGIVVAIKSKFKLDSIIGTVMGYLLDQKSDEFKKFANDFNVMVIVLSIGFWGTIIIKYIL